MIQDGYGLDVVLRGSRDDRSGSERTVELTGIMICGTS